MIRKAHLEISDPVYTPKEKYHWLERLFIPLVNDVRDLPFIKLSLTLLLIFPPLALWLFLDFNWWVASAYLFLNWAVFLGPFILMLHNTSHRSLFKNKYKKWNRSIVWLVGPFFGETPETYFGHHIAMHHPENNLESDLSTTMKYQRDRFSDFLIYFSEFLFIGLIQLIQYLRNKDRSPIARRVILGELSFLLLAVVLSFVNWRAALVVMWLPLFFTRLMMMAGNWGQHAFVDAASPENCYRNSINCINSRYNKMCFNDGYHIGHHVRSSRHWTQMPEDFLNNLERYASEEAIVFEKLDFTVVWFLLMTRQYRKLARHYVQLDAANPKSEEAIIALLKRRTTRIVNREYAFA
jgi:hypothetical protein